MRGAAVRVALNKARRANLAARGLRAPVGGGEGQTRRALLRTLAAGAAAGAVPWAAAAAPLGPVAIVGGGIAGLSALWRLTLAGVDAHLYEARPRLGGRMCTALVDGVAMELGGQFVNSDHADMFALAKAFGVRLIDRKAGGHGTLILAGGRVIPEGEAVEALRPIADQIAADAARLDADYAKAGPALDRLSMAAYLDRHATKLPAPWVRGLLESTARTEYGVEPAQASAIELVWNLPTVKGEAVEVLGASDERYLIEHGSGALIAAMATRLKDRITTGREVVAVERHGGGARLRFADRGMVEASRVIVATPAGVTRRIRFDGALPTPWRRFIDEVRLGHCAKLIATTTARPWEAAIGQGGEVWPTARDSGFAEGWDGSVRPSPGEGAVWTWFLGGDQVAAAQAADPLALARRFAADLEGGAPGMAQATIGARLTGWVQDPLTQGAYVNYRPGQLTRFAPLLWVEEDGKVETPPLSAGPIHFAGEHLSDAYPGYMNGGAQTGRLAAQAVIAAMTARRGA